MHRLEINAPTVSGASATVTLDGHALAATEVTVTLTAATLNMATITLPVELHADVALDSDELITQWNNQGE